MSQREELLPQIPTSGQLQRSRAKKGVENEVCPCCGKWTDKLTDVEGWCEVCAPQPPTKIYIWQMCECGREFQTQVKNKTGTPYNRRCPRCVYRRRTEGKVTKRYNV